MPITDSSTTVSRYIVANDLFDGSALDAWICVAIPKSTCGKSNMSRETWIKPGRTPNRQEKGTRGLALALKEHNSEDDEYDDNDREPQRLLTATHASLVLQITITIASN